MGDCKECRSLRRALQRKVYLAVKLRVMCLHLNERARKREDGEMQAELSGRRLCQAETLEECSSSTITATVIAVRITVFVTPSAESWSRRNR